MRGKVVGLVAAVALLASVGIANAKGPVTLTDGQLDKVTAGASASSTLASSDFHEHSRYSERVYQQHTQLFQRVFGVYALTYGPTRRAGKGQNEAVGLLPVRL